MLEKENSDNKNERNLENRFLAIFLKYKYGMDLLRQPSGIVPSVVFNQSEKNYEPLRNAIVKKLTSSEILYIPSARSLLTLVYYEKNITLTAHDALHIYIHDNNRQIFLKWLESFSSDLQLDYVDDAYCAKVLQSINHFKKKYLNENIVAIKEGDLSSPKAKIPFVSELQKIIITSPVENEQVHRTPIVEGMVFADAQEIWLVVKPSGTINHYVQHKAFVEGNGYWTAQIYIGSQDEGNIGHRFEVRAIANPTIKLYPELLLPKWPNGEFQSSIVEVIRGH